MGTLIPDKNRKWKLGIAFRGLDEPVVCRVNSEPKTKGLGLRPDELEMALLQSFLDNQQKAEQSVEAFLYDEYNSYREANAFPLGRNPITDGACEDDDVFCELASSQGVWLRVIFFEIGFCPGQKVNDIEYEMAITYRFDWDYEHRYALLLKDNRVVEMVDC
ncbi:MAG: DUF6985 domain-containing protein [Phycisphaerales bacterium JB063]